LQLLIAEVIALAALVNKDAWQRDDGEHCKRDRKHPQHIFVSHNTVAELHQGVLLSFVRLQVLLLNARAIVLDQRLFNAFGIFFITKTGG
jgi:hypothetical protein